MPNEKPQRTRPNIDRVEKRAPGIEEILEGAVPPPRPQPTSEDQPQPTPPDPNVPILRSHELTEEAQRRDPTPAPPPNEPPQHEENDSG